MFNYDILSIIIASLSSIFMIYLIAKFTKIYQTNELIRSTASALILIVLGFVTLSLVIGIVSFNYLYDWGFKDDAFFAFGYLSFLILWIMGYNRFLKNTIRLNKDKLRSFKIINRLLNIPITISAFLLITVINIIPAWTNYVTGYISITDLSLASFGIMSQIGVITYVYFYRKLNHERVNNSSKLIKARLQLLSYSIIPMILQSLIILGSVLYLYINNLDGDMFYIILSGIFIFINTMTATASLFIMWSIKIPNRIRVRFNLAPSRFKYIQKA